MSIVIENMRQKDIRPPPCEIEYKNMKFLITDRPTDQNIQNYIQVNIILVALLCLSNTRNLIENYCSFSVYLLGFYLAK